MRNEFASMNSFKLFSNRLQNVFDTLSKLVCDGYSYNKTNTASSTLSNIITLDKVPSGKDLYVKRFVKDIFELRPMFSKYHMTCDVRKICDYFRNLLIITLKKLYFNLAMLLCLIFVGQWM